MGNGTTKPQPSAHDRAELDLKNQRAKSRQYKKRLEGTADDLQNAARTLLKEDKRDKALLCLKRRRAILEQIDRTEKMLDNLEEMINSIEFAQLRNQIFSQLEKGNAMLKELNAQMDVDTVQKIMDDSREAIAYQQEIAEAMKQVLTPQDEQAIEDEYNQMLASMLPVVPSEPIQQPIHPVPVPVLDDEQEEPILL